MEYFLVFIFGIVIGSFLNVCIYRVPRGKSVAFPGSFCPSCEEPIRWYDNIPLISFVVLAAKCRSCGSKIPVKYFLVELSSAVIALILFSLLGLTPAFFIYTLFSLALLTVSVIDMERREIPDVISLPGIVMGILLVTLFRLRGDLVSSLIDSLLGVLVGGGSMFLLGYLGELVFKKDALGGGDIKLMGMIGAFLGWKLVLLTFFIAPMFGSVSSVIMLAKNKREPIAYGPYLAAGAFVSLLFGEAILKYLFVY